MYNTNRSKLKWSRISYVGLSVIVASTILVSFSEHDAYAKGPFGSGEYTFNQFVAVAFIPIVVVGGLGLMTAIARRSLSVNADN